MVVTNKSVNLTNKGSEDVALYYFIAFLMLMNHLPCDNKVIFPTPFSASLEQLLYKRSVLILVHINVTN